MFFVEEKLILNLLTNFSVFILFLDTMIVINYAYLFNSMLSYTTINKFLIIRYTFIEMGILNGLLPWQIYIMMLEIFDKALIKMWLSMSD